MAGAHRADGRGGNPVTGGAPATETPAGVGYRYGFATPIDTEVVRRGLDQEVIRLISAKEDEPAWLADRRLDAFQHWPRLAEPRWQNVRYGPTPSCSPCSTRRGGRLGIGGHHLPDQAGGGRGHLLLAPRGGAQPPRARPPPSLRTTLEGGGDALRSALPGPSGFRHGWQALNRALAAGGAFVRLAPGVTLDRPVQVVHLAAGTGDGEEAEEGRLASPWSVIVAGSASHARVVETFHGLPGTAPMRWRRLMTGAAGRAASTLRRDCPATIVPSGLPAVLRAGTR